MAKIQPSSLVSELRGSVGGVTFARNSYGAYARNKTSPVQPRSPHQMEIRAGFTQVSQQWRDLLVATERAAWDDYAKQTPLSDVFGNKILLTGATMFVRYNATLVGVIAAVLKIAPPLPGEAQMVTPTLTGTVAAGVNITAITPVLIEGDNVMVYSNKAPIPRSREFFNGPWTRRPRLHSGSTYPSLTVPIAEMAIGQRWWIKTRLYKHDGRVGPINIVRIDITA